MTQGLYPLLLEPQFESASWAGAQLKAFYASSKRTDVPDRTAISYLVANSNSRQSVISNGHDAGRTLNELVADNARDVVGSRGAGSGTFPFTVRVLDVGSRQPLMVHPAGSRMSTADSKFWYLLSRTPEGGEVCVGIKHRATHVQVLRQLRSKSFKKLLQVFPAREGDSFFIPPGVVHYLGAGNLTLELQKGDGEPRVVSRWDDVEPDRDEQARAVDGILFEHRLPGRIASEAGRVMHTRKVPLVHNCPEFVVDEIRLKDYTSDRTAGDTFHLMLPVRGAIEISSPAGDATVPTGWACLVPAAMGRYRVVASGKEADFLKVAM